MFDDCFNQSNADCLMTGFSGADKEQPNDMIQWFVVPEEWWSGANQSMHSTINKKRSEWWGTEEKG